MEEIRDGSGTAEVQKMGKTKSSPRFGLIVSSCIEESKSRSTVLFNCVLRETPRLIIDG